MLLDGHRDGHPGEGTGRLGIYARHRITTLASYGLDADFISEHIGLPLLAVKQVIAEEADLIELERGAEREW